MYRVCLLSQSWSIRIDVAGQKGGMLYEKAYVLGIAKKHPGKSLEVGFSTGMGVQTRMWC